MTGALDPLTLWVTRGHRAARVTRFPLRASGAQTHCFYVTLVSSVSAGAPCAGPRAGREACVGLTRAAARPAG